MKAFDAFGDRYFLEKFKELVVDYSIETVVETGTWLGDFIITASRFVKHAISIEIQRQFFEGTKARFISEGYSQVPVPKYIAGGEATSYVKEKSTITLICGNSPDVIRRIIEELPEPILFYLDAHWLAYWPIKDEIRAIKPRPNSIIIIDDFKVPGKGWHYDSYKGVDLDYELVKDDLAFVNPNYITFYNEEGPRAGILYVVPPKDVQHGI